MSAAQQQHPAPPHSIEAEQSVIGAVLLDNAAWQSAFSLLPLPDAFYHPAHRVLWHCMAKLIMANKPADPITVHDALQAQGMAAAAGGLAYIGQLFNATYTVGNVAAYARIVQQRAVARQLIALGKQLADQAHDVAATPDGPAGLIDATIAQLAQLQQGDTTGAEPRQVVSLLPAWLDQLEARARGETDAIPTGLTDLDNALAGGLRRGEVMVIGARPSMGKSALMLTLTRAMSARVPVLVCSLEDSDMMLVSRMVAAAGRVNLAHIRMPDRAPDALWTAVTEGVDQLQHLQLYLDDAAGMRLVDVERKAQQVKRRAGDLGVVVVDYLQLMEGEGETRAYELTSIARGMKRLAKRMRCAVLVLSQLNREADKTDSPPRLDHLAESDGLQQAADIVGLLYRQARRKPTAENKYHAQLELAKNKNGATDTVHLHFDGAHQHFADRTTGHHDD